jgi:hypothetical protein
MKTENNIRQEENFSAICHRKCRLTLAAPLNLFAGEKTENPQAPKAISSQEGYAGKILPKN